MDRVNMSGRLGFSLDLSQEEFQVLTGEDRGAAQELLVRLVQSEQCTIVGDTYFPAEWNEEALAPVMEPNDLRDIDMEPYLEFDLPAVCPSAKHARTLESLNGLIDHLIDLEGGNPRRVVGTLLELGFTADELIELRFDEDDVRKLAEEMGVEVAPQTVGFAPEPVAPQQDRYSIARDVAFEDFKNELECLDYSVEDFSEEELAAMFEEFEMKLSGNSTYNAIYGHVAEEVARNQVAIKQRAAAEAEYDARDVAQPGYGDFPTLEEIKRDYYELMDIIKGVKTIDQAREIEEKHGIPVEINGVSIDEFVNGLKTINGRADGRGTDANIQWIRYEAYGCLSYVYDWFGAAPTFDVWSNAADNDFVTDIHFYDLTPANYAQWVSEAAKLLDARGVKLNDSVEALIARAGERSSELDVAPSGRDEMEK